MKSFLACKAQDFAIYRRYCYDRLYITLLNMQTPFDMWHHVGAHSKKFY